MRSPLNFGDALVAEGDVDGSIVGTARWDSD
jgi:hypothetical protein